MGLLVPEALFLSVGLRMTNGRFAEALYIGSLGACLSSTIHATRLQVHIVIHLFVRATTATCIALDLPTGTHAVVYSCYVLT